MSAADTATPLSIRRCEIDLSENSDAKPKSIWTSRAAPPLHLAIRCQSIIRFDQLKVLDRRERVIEMMQ